MRSIFRSRNSRSTAAASVDGREYFTAEHLDPSLRITEVAGRIPKERRTPANMKHMNAMYVESLTDAAELRW
nr:hypothetical protein [Arabidopsis thaliana]